MNSIVITPIKNDDTDSKQSFNQGHLRNHLLEST